MSFHPADVVFGDTGLNRCSVLVTDGSSVDIDAQIDRDAATGKTRGDTYAITTEEQEQIRLFKTSLTSSQANNASPRSHDKSGPYGFLNKNCSGWNKNTNDDAGVKPKDSTAYLKMNGGVGQGTGLDLTGIPQTVDMAARGAVMVADTIKDSVDVVTKIASTVGQTIGNVLSPAKTKSGPSPQPTVQEIYNELRKGK